MMDSCSSEECADYERWSLPHYRLCRIIDRGGVPDPRNSCRLNPVRLEEVTTEQSYRSLTESRFGPLIGPWSVLCDTNSQYPSRFS